MGNNNNLDTDSVYYIPNALSNPTDVIIPAVFGFSPFPNISLTIIRVNVVQTSRLVIALPRQS